MRALRALVALTLPALAAACELITNAGDYEVAPAVPYSGLCTECTAAGADLSHPPCPPETGPTLAGQPVVYATRRMYFGKPAEWRGSQSDAFRLGFDLDCSDRPGGEPVRCQAREVTGASALPWAQMPHGIDNSTLQRIFTPLYDTAADFGQPFDIDEEYSKNQELGRLGILVVVDQWNGTPEDPEVTLTIYSSPGVASDNGPPRWDGTDRWDLYGDVAGSDTKFFKVTKAPGYVSGGTLVADYRSRGDVSLRFGSPTGSFRILVHDVFLVGKIAPDRIEYLVMSALADLASTFESVPDLAKVLSACNPAAEAYLHDALSELLVGAADMPAGPETGPSDPCDAISFAWALDAERALLSGGKSDTSIDGGCL